VIIEDTLLAPQRGKRESRAAGGSRAIARGVPTRRSLDPRSRGPGSGLGNRAHALRSTGTESSRSTSEASTAFGGSEPRAASRPPRCESSSSIHGHQVRGGDGPLDWACCAHEVCAGSGRTHAHVTLRDLRRTSNASRLGDLPWTSPVMQGATISVGSTLGKTFRPDVGRSFVWIRAPSDTPRPKVEHPTVRLQSRRNASVEVIEGFEFNGESGASRTLRAQ
jgi:hypothetical protein